jgi:hypothetical protein
MAPLLAYYMPFLEIVPLSPLLRKIMIQINLDPFTKIIKREQLFISLWCFAAAERAIPWHQ